MPSWIGPWEIAIVLVLVLLIFGPRKLPDLGASLGKSIRGFKKGLKETEDEVSSAVAEVREATDVSSAEPQAVPVAQAAEAAPAAAASAVAAAVETPAAAAPLAAPVEATPAEAVVSVAAVADPAAAEPAVAESVAAEPAEAEAATPVAEAVPVETDRAQ